MVSQNGTCCPQGSSLDALGGCCSSFQDACGTCGGNATAVDFTGGCCAGVLDAGGLCCSGAVDEFGVCGGSGSSGALALTTDAISSVGVQGGVSCLLLLCPALNTRPAEHQRYCYCSSSTTAALEECQGRPCELLRHLTLTACRR